MYKKHGKTPKEAIWLDIKNITGVSSAEAQAVQSEIRKWYSEDINFVPEDNPVDDQKSFMQQDATNNGKQTLSQTLEAPNVSKPDSAKITLNVGGKSYQLEIDDKDSMEASMAILNLLGKKIGLRINTEDIPSKTE